MKLAVTASGPDLESKVEARFGRCPYFMIVDPDTMQFEAMENPNIALGGGAGIQSAQLMAQKDVEIVLTGNCGPNAFQVFGTAGIKVIVGVSGVVRDAVERFKAGAFAAAESPNVASHFGMNPGVDSTKQSVGSSTIGGSMGQGMGGGMGRGGGRGMGMGGGRGMGRGMGGGMGRGMGGGMQPPLQQGSPAMPGVWQVPQAPASREDEIAALKQESEALQGQLGQIDARIRELETGAAGTGLVARVAGEQCNGCGRCVSVCPAGAISIDQRIALIDDSKCNGCGQCIQVCPQGAILLAAR